jgi:hypothetical protein
VNRDIRSGVADLATDQPTSRVRFVATAVDVPRPPNADLTVVLDTAWTPGPAESPRVVPLRRYFARAVEEHDLFEEALDLVDSWAAETHLADLLVVEGVTYWFRVRESLWHWVHERLLWRYALALIDAQQPSAWFSVPESEKALIDVAWREGRTFDFEGQPDRQVDSPTGNERRPTGRGLRAIALRLVRRLRPKPESSTALEHRRRITVLQTRLTRMSAGTAARVVVLAVPSNYQSIGAAGDLRRQDPNLGSVIAALGKAGHEPVVIGWRMNTGREHDWRSLELDEHLLPSDLVQSRWGRPEDDRRAETAVEAVVARLAALPATPLRLGVADLAGPFVAALQAILRQVIDVDVHELARAERLIADLAPRAILMSQEGGRTAWLIAGARARVPTFAIQHGVLYRTHPGYPSVRHPALVLPTLTFVYGDYSRRVLLAGAYDEAQVEVSGSPRVELDQRSDALVDAVAARSTERIGVRRELAVAEADRLLVVSTLNLEFVRRSHFVHMLERTLGGPLPGVHVVFKQHPAERDQGPYRALLEGLAEAGGYDPPPISVVRDIDLYRLLRAADAHLSLFSTVLTDAVEAGTPNLIAIVEGHADLLGYVQAGVAQPVSSVTDVMAALDHPVATEPVARRTFLDDHFRPGVPSQRIVEAIGSRLG